MRRALMGSALERISDFRLGLAGNVGLQIPESSNRYPCIPLKIHLHSEAAMSCPSRKVTNPISLSQSNKFPIARLWCGIVFEIDLLVALSICGIYFPKAGIKLSKACSPGPAYPNR